MAMSTSTRAAKATTAKRTVTKKSTTSRSTKAASTKAPAKGAATKKAAKKSTAKQAPPKKTPAKKTPAKKTPARAAKKSASGKVQTTAAAGNGRAAKVNGKAKSPFSATFLAKQKQALLDERAVYLHQAEAFEAEADSLIADFEPGDVQFDEESGEGDTLSMERERDLVLSAQARSALEEIDHALAKFDLGTYGICEVSGDPIPKERLEAIPWAKERVEFKAGSFGSP
jgi:RNA polymerase-binding transcription factor DksA